LGVSAATIYLLYKKIEIDNHEQKEKDKITRLYKYYLHKNNANKNDELYVPYILKKKEKKIISEVFGISMDKIPDKIYNYKPINK